MKGHVTYCEHRIQELSITSNYNFVEDEEIKIYDQATDTMKAYGPDTKGAPSNPYYVITYHTRYICLSNRMCSTNFFASEKTHPPDVVELMTPKDFEELKKGDAYPIEGYHEKNGKVVPHLSHWGADVYAKN